MAALIIQDITLQRLIYVMYKFDEHLNLILYLRFLRWFFIDLSHFWKWLGTCRIFNLLANARSSTKLSYWYQCTS